MPLPILEPIIELEAVVRENIDFWGEFSLMSVVVHPTVAKSCWAVLIYRFFERKFYVAFRLIWVCGVLFTPINLFEWSAIGLKKWGCFEGSSFLISINKWTVILSFNFRLCHSCEREATEISLFPITIPSPCECCMNFTLIDCCSKL